MKTQEILFRVWAPNVDGKWQFFECHLKSGSLIYYLDGAEVKRVEDTGHVNSIVNNIKMNRSFS